MTRDERRLCVFFSAGATRYALDAVRVLEVARQSHGQLQLSPHVPVRDLSALLGGDAAVEPKAALTLDVSPTLAVRVSEVSGVFDVAAAPHFRIQGRLIPLVAPAVAGALELEGRLVFELDAEAAARGLPRQSRPLIRHTREPEQALAFTVEGTRWALPLHHVVQVVEAGPRFNRAPNAGTLVGIVQHRDRLWPVFTLGSLGVVQPLIVLFEVNGDGMGFAVSSVDGVRTPSSLGQVPMLDLRHMFS